MVDRVNTTGTVWLGLTVGCAQCHSHKYDPFTQRDFYKLMAFLNNADEPEMPVPQSEIAQRQADIDKKVAQAEKDAHHFPFSTEELEWTTAYPSTFLSRVGSKFEPLQDGSLRVLSTRSDPDQYTIELAADVSEVVAIRIEAMTDPSLPKGGPGKTDHGNFVLSEVALSLLPPAGSANGEKIELRDAETDYDQPNFAGWQAIDGIPSTGWAVHRPGTDAVGEHTITIQFARSVSVPARAKWVLLLDQNLGQNHTLGRFRVSFGQFRETSVPLDVRRLDRLDKEFVSWKTEEEKYATHWSVLRPAEAKSNMPYLTILSDDSVLSSGDQTKSDTYDLRFKTKQSRISAIRLEAIPDERLPRGGPGRIYYEGPIGDFLLSEFTVKADGQPVKIRRGSRPLSEGAMFPSGMIDGDKQSGWGIDGGQGRPHVAVFELDDPTDVAETLDVSMLFERYYAAGLGRFRISITSDERESRESLLPANIEDLLARGGGAYSEEEKNRLYDYFLSFRAETEAARRRVEELRKQRPEFPTTLVLSERPPEFPRRTYVHKRGEFLQPGDPVEPYLPSMFPSGGADSVKNRMQFAQWLVSPNHPLTAAGDSQSSLGYIFRNGHRSNDGGSRLSRGVALPSRVDRLVGGRVREARLVVQAASPDDRDQCDVSADFPRNAGTPLREMQPID